MSHVHSQAEGHVLEIRLSRPEKLNALSPEMYRDLGLAYAELDRNDALRVGLIHAQGAHFTAGIELDKWAPIFAAGQGFPQHADALDIFALNTPRCRKPLVMAVQGYCYTWGVESMLNTDVRVAARDARFAMLEVRRGIYPCGGATLRLAQQMGWANAQRYLLTGDPWSADEALRLGLVQEVVEPGQQYAVARALAERIASAAPLGVQAVLRHCRRAQLEGESGAIEHLFEDLPGILASDDAREGVQSFLERREAVFRGR